MLSNLLYKYLFRFVRLPLVWSKSTFTLDPVPVLRYRKLSSAAITPTRATPGSAGYDLYSSHDAVVEAHGKALIKTNLQFAIPSNCYGRIAPRSGLALKHHIHVGAGVVDSDYRGDVGILLFNHGSEDFVVHRGDRVAQLICELIVYPELEEIFD